MSKPTSPKINWGNPLTKGLVFDFPLFEQSGNPVELVHRIKTTSNSAASTWAAGVYGSVLSFSGSNASLSTPTISGPPAFTHIALINPVGATIRAITGDSNGGGDPTAGPEFRIEADNTLGLIQQNITNIGASTGTVTNGIWNFVAVTYDATGKYVFYINAVPAGSGTNLVTMAPGQLQIGANVPGSSDFFNGSIALVRVYNYALSPAAIRQLYQDPWQIYTKPGMLQSLNTIVAVAASNKVFKTLLGAGNI